MIIQPQGSAITTNGENPQKESEEASAGESLVDDILQNIIYDNEKVRAAFTSPDGVTRVVEGEKHHVDTTVVMTVTDQRVVVVDAQAETIDADAGSLKYSDLAAVSTDAGNSIELATTEGVSWQFTLPNTEESVVDAVVRHLVWVGELRSRLLTCKNNIELAAGRIRDHAAEMNWEEAEQIYDENRERLDRLICAAQWTKPIDIDDLTPELTTVERTLEEAHTRVYIERARSQLALSQQLIENEDYDLGCKPLRQARRYYERASGQAHAVERGDAFQFGTQRDLKEELDSLEWEIDSVAAQPMGQAREAQVSAENASDRTSAIEYWETAYRRYEEVLELNWGEGRTDYAGDATTAREGKEKAGTALVDLYTELAKERWDAGIEEYQTTGDVKASLRTCIDAWEALDRAVAMAEEYAPERVKALEIRLGNMESELETMRESESETTEDIDTEVATTKTEVPDGTERESHEESEIPSVTELSELDTHHEITLEIKDQAAHNDESETREGNGTVPDRENGPLFSESE